MSLSLSGPASSTSSQSFNSRAIELRLCNGVNPDNFVRTQLAAEGGCGQTDWSESSDQYGVIAADADLFQPLVHGPNPQATWAPSA